MVSTAAVSTETPSLKEGELKGAIVTGGTMRPLYERAIDKYCFGGRSGLANNDRNK